MHRFAVVCELNCHTFAFHRRAPPRWIWRFCHFRALVVRPRRGCCTPLAGPRWSCVRYFTARGALRRLWRSCVLVGALASWPTTLAPLLFVGSEGIGAGASALGASGGVDGHGH